eukprot:5888669-Amphidinium_carterae.1
MEIFPIAKEVDVTFFLAMVFHAHERVYGACDTRAHRLEVITTIVSVLVLLVFVCGWVGGLVVQQECNGILPTVSMNVKHTAG